MAGPYYVDLSIPYSGTHVSTDGSAEMPWGGPTGLQRAKGAAAAGDTIYVRNAADPLDNTDLSGMWKVPLASTTNLVITDLVTIDAAGENVTARVGVIVTDDYIIVEHVSGGDLAAAGAADTITSAPGGLNSTLDGTPTQPGLLIHSDFCASGTTAAPIIVQGVANDWTTHEAAYLECTGALNGITTDGVSYWQLRHLAIQSPEGAGIWKVSNANVYGWIFDHVTVDDAGAEGWKNSGYFYAAPFIDCEATNNAADGIANAPVYATIIRLVCSGNGVDGIGSLTDSGTVIDSLIVNNDGDGVVMSHNGCLIKNCIIDGNGSDGVAISNGRYGNVIIDNRITNNGAFGVQTGDSGQGHFLDGNVFIGNASGTVNGVSCGPNDHGPVGDTDIPTEANRDVTADGYTDDAGGDYSLVSDATLRREAVTIGSTTFYKTAGLSPPDRPRIPRMIGGGT